MAMLYYEKAIHQGRIPSLYKLGMLLLSLNCEDNSKQKKGIGLIKKAAERGYINAMEVYGIYLCKGIIVKQNQKLGEWFLQQVQVEAKIQNKSINRDECFFDLLKW